MLSDLDKKVILALQRDLEIRPRPFLEVAEYLGIGEEELLHQQSGYEANALVAWAVPEADLQRIGQHLAGKRSVTHCYARRPASSWPYNLYTMIHGRTPEECIKIAAQMAAETGIHDYEMLFSETELKKTTMRYFKEGTSGGPRPE
jgi:DNA-binding Lrp family transcriptional regulator